MNKTNNPKLKDKAQFLRRNMTKEERRLWYDFLKKLSVTVNRQKVINNYIADFYIASEKLVIELDGSQHYEDDAIQYDAVRNSYFESLGFTVLRYTNEQINKNFEDVCNDITNHFSTSSVTFR